MNHTGVEIELYSAITAFYKVQLQIILCSLNIWYHSAKSKISCNTKYDKLGALHITFLYGVSKITSLKSIGI